MRFPFLMAALAVVLLPLPALAKERVVKVAAHDMGFDPAAVEAKAGETVRFEITNRGQVLHEFAVGTVEENAAHRQMMASMSSMHDHGAMHGHDHAAMHGHGAAHPQKVVMVEPGKTAVLKVRFDKPGRLELACNIPGHYESGMAGTLDIKPRKEKP